MDDMISKAEAQDLLDAVMGRLNSTTSELLQSQAAVSKERRASAGKEKRIEELEAKLSELETAASHGDRS